MNDDDLPEILFHAGEDLTQAAGLIAVAVDEEATDTAALGEAGKRVASAYRFLALAKAKIGTEA